MAMVLAIRNDKGQLVKLAGSTKAIPTHLKSLRIPPAWTDVYVDTDPKAKMMVRGVDAAGRSQRIYSTMHTEASKAVKFERVSQLIENADHIKAQIEIDIKAKNSVYREEATVAYLIFETGIRPGSTKETGGLVKAYGATTLRASHVKIMGSGRVWLDFVGKKGVRIKLRVTNPWLVEELIRRKAKAGVRHSTPLFETSDSLLREYVDTMSDGLFTPKDFRTMRGTSLAAALLDGRRMPATKTAFEKVVREVVKKVATALGNTPAVCRKSYIDPSVIPVFQG